MGWDVVEIGLRHNLPVNDPFATAKEVAKRMKQNVRLVYQNEYEYDTKYNTIRYINSYDLIELAKFEVNNSDTFLQMNALNYRANQILELAGIDKLHKAADANKLVKSILEDIEEPDELYEIEDDDEHLSIRIYKENVELDVYITGRWDSWERAFHHLGSEKELLRNYRMQIHNQAKLFGCNEVIIFSDQGPTQLIYDRVNYPTDALKEYARSFQYLEEATWIKEDEKEDWKNHAKHIMFPYVFKDGFILSDEDWVEVVYDDFSDIVII